MIDLSRPTATTYQVLHGRNYESHKLLQVTHIWGIQISHSHESQQKRRATHLIFRLCYLLLAQVATLGKLLANNFFYEIYNVF